jgi:WD40 repeat protein
VVAVDQFEELFTACRDEDERSAFVDALVSCTRRRVLLLVAVRADYYGACAAYPELARLLGANHVLVGPMRRDELRRAIELPARRAGARVEPDLVDALVAGVEGRPGALPLLSTSLLELWGRRDGQVLRLAEHERAGGELYRGARLAAALDWSATHERELNPLERDFLADSRAESESESRRQRRANRRLRTLLGGVAALLALALVAGAVAVSQRGQARDAARTADAQRLGAEAQTRDDLDQALLLARAGVELDDSAATRSQLLTVLMREPQAIGTLTGDWDPLHYQSLSPDGRRLALASSHGTVTFFDTARRRPVGRPYRLRTGFVTDLKFSPDGRTLAVAGWDETRAMLGGVVDLVDARTHARRLQVVVPPFPGGATWLGVHVLFLPNGRDIVVQQVHVPIDVAGPPSVLRRFDGATGAAVGGPVRVGRHQTVAMWGTGDRRRLFVTSAQDNETHMLDVRPLRVLRRWPVGDFAGVVSLDGTLFALGSQRGDVRLLDLRSGRVRSFAGRHDASVLRMRFSADARTLVTTGADGAVIVWDVERGEPRQTLTGHARGLVWGLEVTPDGRTAYSAGEDQHAFVWDLTGDQSLARPFAVARAFVPDDGDTLPRGIAVSPDGRTLAIGHSDGMVDLLDPRTLRRRAGFRALPGFVAALAFSPDGHVLAAGGQHGRLTLWDSRTLRRLGELRGQTTTSQTLAFSPDGALLASAELGTPTEAETDFKGGGVRVWDLRARSLTAIRVPLATPAIAISANGRWLAIAGNAQPTEVRDARNGQLVAKLPTPYDGRSVAFSPDGGLIVTGHYDGTVQAWSTDTWKPVGRLLEGHEGKRVLWMGFTPDGATLATAGQDGTVQLFDMATRTALGPPLSVETDSYLAAALAPDGRHLFVVPTGRGALRWDLSPAAWKQHACRVAGRELTRREWDDALPGAPYRTVCRLG